MDIKENVALNLIKYRKALSLTQLELAEKLNYSDKAVSKWERAESVPDIYVLQKIADLFGISVDTLISPPREEKPSILKQIGRIRLIKGFASAVGVWLIAIIGFFFLEVLFPVFNDTWLLFIYAVPITLAILLILATVWKKNFWYMIFHSLFWWTLILSVFLSLNVFLANPPSKLWEIFLLGIPLQFLIIFSFLYKSERKKKHK